MLSEYKICGNMTKYINIYNAYPMYVLNKLYVYFSGGVGEAGSQCRSALHCRLLHFSLALRQECRQQHYNEVVSLHHGVHHHKKHPSMSKQESREERTLFVKGICDVTFLQVGVGPYIFHPGTAFKRRTGFQSRVRVCLYVCAA